MNEHKFSTMKFTYLALVLLFLSKNATAIMCYQCNSTSERTCGESLPQHHSLVPLSCSHIQEAQFCVKMTGVVEGQLGTKRFCSSRDWGNYCEWVQRPGDEREYRACVFTCQTDGCNHAHMTRVSLATLLIMPFLLITRLMV
ncbi:hypothetical protein Pmani_021397 [Petrolisthes manimaculis]|uniref:Protein sleepless n=1 Tax=Petrolisthes manimaculis TaxID=1843537 RepID=A0AAE1U273_9EUCA|nr:hypothetical protein Pmani_021397 [Petrolisthes manimaculis]